MTTPGDTIARLRARNQEAGKFVLCLDAAWAEKLNDAYARVRQAEAIAPEDVKLDDLRAEVAHLESLAGDNAIVFRFRRLGKPELEELWAAHPATEKQRKVWAEQEIPTWQRKVWDEDTFEPDLLAHCCIEPRLTYDEALAILRPAADDPNPLLSAVEARQLADAAYAAAVASTATVPKELRLP